MLDDFQAPASNTFASIQRVDIYSEEQERQLFEELRKERLRLAKELKGPAYIVFLDKTLIEFCKKMPLSRHEMLRIDGVTDQKYEEFGPYFIELIRQFRDRNPPAGKTNRNPA